MANFSHQNGEPLPGVAPVAMQQAKYVAGLVGKQLRNPEKADKAPAFRYRNHGIMATIGRGAAVADILGVKFSGLFAWLAWLFIHLMYLVEFESRLLVLFQWGWNYTTYNRSARLITRVSVQPDGKESEKPYVSVEEA
jgi:NADH dehydrogenase